MSRRVWTKRSSIVAISLLNNPMGFSFVCALGQRARSGLSSEILQNPLHADAEAFAPNLAMTARRRWDGYFFFRGTFLPFLRALDSAMAIACLRLFTLPPFPPLPLFAGGLPSCRKALPRQ